METVVGLALILIGAAGIAFRRVFSVLAGPPERLAMAARRAPVLRWRGWLVLELGLIAAGTAVLAFGAV